MGHVSSHGGCTGGSTSFLFVFKIYNRLLDCSWQRASLLLACFFFDSATSFVRITAFHPISFEPRQAQVFAPDGDSSRSEEEELQNLEEKGRSLDVAEAISKDREAFLAPMASTFSRQG
jgi:hypothetical protein